MKWLKRIALALVVVFLGLQLIRPEHSNPPVTGEVAAPPEVAALLRRACYDCHSNETKWPWYSHVAPVSFVVTHHVNDGRKHLNFSVWQGYEEARRQKKRTEIEEEVNEGEMPIPGYVAVHAEARLTEAEKATLVAWARGPVEPAPAPEVVEPPPAPAEPPPAP